MRQLTLPRPLLMNPACRAGGSWAGAVGIPVALTLRTFSALMLAAMLHASAHSATVTAGAARVVYEGIEQSEAASLARTVSVSRKILVNQFALDLPRRVVLHVRCGAEEIPQLRTDGLNQIWLTLQRKEQLQRPAVSGIFTLYGLCHELGHMAMYRALRHRDWLAPGAAEGWAHWVGSVVVDEVWQAEGRTLWLDPYDYSQDGTARLRNQLAAADPNAVTTAAGLWWRLEDQVGRKRMGRLLHAWEAAAIDATQPASALVEALVNFLPARKQALETWSETALPLLVEPAQASEFKTQRVTVARLGGNPVSLGYGDGSPDGKIAMGAIAHVIRFQAPDTGAWYLRRMSVYGDRYGTRWASGRSFELTLCDQDNKRVAVWTKPYGTFPRGKPGWVHFEIAPTQVPRDFCLGLFFRPTDRDGVHVAWDTSSTGHSAVGVPGKSVTPFEAGDWMIRVEVDQPARL